MKLFRDLNMYFYFYKYFMMRYELLFDSMMEKLSVH